MVEQSNPRLVFGLEVLNYRSDQGIVNGGWIAVCKSISMPLHSV